MARSWGRWGAVCGVLGCCLLVGGAAVAAPGQAPQTESFSLANGLQVHVETDGRLPSSALALEFLVGTDDDPDGLEGLTAVAASYVQESYTRHLSPEQRDALARTVGAREWGASVSARHLTTLLQLEIPTEALELALQVESDRVAFSAEGVNAVSIQDATRTVRTRQITWAESRHAGVPDLAFAVAAGPGHPWSRWGRPAREVAVFPTDLVARWVADRFQAGNARLGIASPLTSAELRPLVERWFGPLAGHAVARPAVPPLTPRRVRAEARAAGDEALLATGWVTPSFLQDDDARLDVLAWVLFSRLTAAFADPARPPRTLRVRQHSLPPASLFVVQIGAPRPEELPDVERVLHETLSALAQQGPTVAETDAAASVIASHLDDPDATPTATRLLSFTGAQRPTGFLPAYFQLYRRTRPGDVGELAARYLTTEQRVVVEVRPDRDAPAAGVLVTPPPPPPPQGSGALPPLRPSRADDRWLKLAPVAPVRPFTLSPGTTRALAGGVRLHVAERPSELVWTSLALTHPTETNLLDAASRALWAFRVPGEGRALGAALAASGGMYWPTGWPFGVRLSAARSHQAAALGLVTRTLAAGELPESDWIRARDEVAGELDKLTIENRALYFARSRLPEAHPQHRPYFDGAAQLRRTTLAEFRKRWKRTLAEAGLEVHVAGPLAVADAEASVSEATRRLRTRGPARRAKRDEGARGPDAPRERDGQASSGGAQRRLYWLDRPGDAALQLVATAEWPTTSAAELGGALALVNASANRVAAALDQAKVEGRSVVTTRRFELPGAVRVEITFTVPPASAVAALKVLAGLHQQLATAPLTTLDAERIRAEVWRQQGAGNTASNWVALGSWSTGAQLLDPDGVRAGLVGASAGTRPYTRPLPPLEVCVLGPLGRLAAELAGAGAGELVIYDESGATRSKP